MIKYVVKKGDTLHEIADAFNVTVSAIVANNPKIKNPNLIQVGWPLVIPSESTGDTVGVNSDAAIGKAIRVALDAVCKLPEFQVLERVLNGNED